MHSWQDKFQNGNLLLAGLQKTTLIDYPGKVGCVIFFSGCNFHCPYCHNPELAKGRLPNPITLDDLTTFIDQRRQLLDGVVISGGEPTLSPDLEDLCRHFREMGLAIKLDTNGSRPEVLAHLIGKGLVDYIAMDIKTAPRQYDALANDTGIGDRICASIRCIMEHCSNYEFRTTCARPFINEVILDEIGKMIQGASLYVLQTCQTGDLLDPDFLNQSEISYSVSQMNRLQKKASAWVKQCRIR